MVATPWPVGCRETERQCPTEGTGLWAGIVQEGVDATQRPKQLYEALIQRFGVWAVSRDKDPHRVVPLHPTSIALDRCPTHRVPHQNRNRAEVAKRDPACGCRCWTLVPPQPRPAVADSGVRLLRCRAGAREQDPPCSTRVLQLGSPDTKHIGRD